MKNMITEDYISFETAKLLNGKGFDEKCNSFYRKILVNNKLIDKEELHLAGTLFLTNSELQEKSYKQVVYCTAPTLQMTMKWLREIHNLHIMVDCIGAKNYIPTIQFTRNSKDIEIKSKISKIGGNGFDSYEEACEAAIKYALENLI